MIVVTAAIVEKDGRVLAARRKEGKHLAGFWEFPGGKLEVGETPEQCLARELEEEFGVTVEVGAFFGESVYNYGGKVIKLLAYRVSHQCGELRLIDHDEIRWLNTGQFNSVKWAPADIPLVDQYQSLKATQSYYSKNAKAYCDETIKIEISSSYHFLLSNLQPGAHILDLGCGSGRDSLEFLERGYQVTAVDGCPEISAYASTTIGKPVIVKSFDELDYLDVFDGIWANASLLHCTKSQIFDAIGRAVVALKSDGLMYMTFKKGRKDQVDKYGRFFNNYTIESLTELLEQFPHIETIDVSNRSSLLRGVNQAWVQALVKKRKPQHDAISK